VTNERIPDKFEIAAMKWEAVIAGWGVLRR
jgi:hypothetical protein